MKESAKYLIGFLTLAVAAVCLHLMHDDSYQPQTLLSAPVSNWDCLIFRSEFGGDAKKAVLPDCTSRTRKTIGEMSYGPSYTVPKRTLPLNSYANVFGYFSDPHQHVPANWPLIAAGPVKVAAVKRGEFLALPFLVPSRGSVFLMTSETPNFPNLVAAISVEAGSFVGNKDCAAYGMPKGYGIPASNQTFLRLAVNWSGGGARCSLKPGATAYLNIAMSDPTQDTNGCPASKSACDIAIIPYGAEP